ncbi:MAG: nucleotide pyrophosphatase/phosphodiesterase family protein, partial [Planctomycetota bacterium]
MRPLLVIDVVGLTRKLISAQSTPHLYQFLTQGFFYPLKGVLPLVTCSSQSTILTGKTPSEHGIVANGWYFRDLAQVFLWRQSNGLVQSDNLLDEAKLRNPSFTSAKMFWWYNMYSHADISVTPRPAYLADGRKIPDVYTKPYSLRDSLTQQFGCFPLFRFWGPATDISATTWITNATLSVMDSFQPTLVLVYLPHLDYNLQRLGPEHLALHKDLKEVDLEVGRLLKKAKEQGRNVAILSEYGIYPVNKPVHINLILRKHGFLGIHHQYGMDQLDCGNCRAFAVSDHQIAHVYVADPRDIPAVRELLLQTEGIAHVLSSREEKESVGLAHERSGEIIVLSQKDRWFTYYFWENPDDEPDFARTVDIHRKPGYDPVELFREPGFSTKLKIFHFLLKKTLGFRALMKIIPLN